MLNMTDLQIANLAWYRRTKDLVPLFDPKVHLFENCSLQIMAQLHIHKKHICIWSLLIQSIVEPSIPISLQYTYIHTPDIRKLVLV